MQKIFTHQILGIFLLSLLPLQVYSEETVTVAWRVKAPYQYVENGVEKGFLLQEAKLIFGRAKIPAQFQAEPAKRIWTNFAAGSKSYCSFDWYKNPERERHALFSKGWRITPPYSILTNQASAAAVSSHADLTALLADPGLTLGLVDSVSYGTELDGMIKGGKNKLERASVLPMIMARMVAANRASYMFIDKTEWAYLQENDGHLPRTKIVDMKGAPKGLHSYIVCSKDMTATRMARINRAIQQLRKENREP
jgi:polar amino acid transport system substrate-binding protein